MNQYTKNELIIVNELIEVLTDDTDNAIEFLVNGCYFDNDKIDEMGCSEIFSLVKKEISEYDFDTLKSTVEYLEIDGWDKSKMNMESQIKDGSPRKACKKPCPSCPYTKNAVRGYFGGHEPDEYANAIHQDTIIACHSRTKHNKESGIVESMDDVTICTGHIVSQIKVCKSSMHKDGAEAQKQVRASSNFEKLKENALGFDFKSYHGID